MRVMIRAEAAPLYGEPSDGAEMIDEGLHGMTAEILEERGGFLRVRMFYGYEGYIRAGDLCRRAAFDRARLVDHAAADVLERPNVKGGRVMTLTRGCVAEALEECGDGWTKVGTAAGTGYMRSAFLGGEAAFDRVGDARAEEGAFREAVAAAAASYAGTQYRWGGKTARGIDCSGLCSISYLMNGVVIYRDAAIREGFLVKEVPPGRMKRGDLLYFRGEEPGAGDRPGHMALYLEDGRFVHSSAANNGVRVNSLNPRHGDYAPGLAGRFMYCGSLFV